MKKFMLLFLCVILLTVSAAASAQQAIVVGQADTYNLKASVAKIQSNAGDVFLYLTSNVSDNEVIEIPSGTRSVTIASIYGSPATVNLNGSLICANGVPFTVESNVSITNGFLVGGSCITQPGTVSVDRTMLTVNGNVGYVIGGGLAMGSGAVSEVSESNVVLNGAADLIFGGGYAYNGGQANINGMSVVTIGSNASVQQAAYGGGYADGSGSVANAQKTTLTNQGKASAVFPEEGLASNGGKAQVGAPQQIQLNNPSFPFFGGGGGQPSPAAQNTEMYVGPNQQAQNFNDVMNLLPRNVGNLTISITGSFMQNSDVVVPDNRGITSVTLVAANGPVTVTWPEDVGFFANGIPLTISRAVTFNNGTIYGGANVGIGQQSYLPSTYLSIAGNVNKVVGGSKAKGAAANARVENVNLVLTGKAEGWLYGGGSALYGGYSSVDGTVFLTTEQGSSAMQSIAGGGFAFGSGSQSVVTNAQTVVNGSVVYAVYAGGYADQSSYASVDGYANITIGKTGNVGQSIWYGGRAFKNSSVYVAAVSSQVSGRVGAYIHQEGKGTDGGTSEIGRIY